MSISVAQEHEKWIGKRVAVKLEVSQYIYESCASAVGTVTDVKLMILGPSIDPIKGDLSDLAFMVQEVNNLRGVLEIWIKVKMEFGTCLVKPVNLRLLEGE
tara:strand:+ start:403 stop:705 length:303 start_codon:yes stop_codon:yes gene_type:complete